MSASPALLVPSRLNTPSAAPAKEPFSLPALPYAVAAHPELAGKSWEDLVRGWRNLPEAVHTAVRNNGGGHVDHSFFWQSLPKSAGNELTMQGTPII